jgi:anti-sigma B factor antagonist
VTRCRLSGELDYASADRLLAAATGALDGRAGVLELQLDELRLCDAAGVTALLRVQAIAARHGARIRLSGAHGIVRRVFEIVGLDRAMQVV